MKRGFRRLILISFLLLLAGSLAANFWLYRRGSLYYRTLSRLRLDPLGLNALPVVEANAAKRKIVFFGDSRAAGWPAPSGDGKEQFINRGIGGQTTAQIMGRFQAHITPLMPNVVILQMGINDLKTIPLFPGDKQKIIESCIQHLDEAVAAARKLGAAVIVSTIFPVGEVPLERRFFWSPAVGEGIFAVNAHIKRLNQEGVVIFDAAAILADGDGMLKKEYRQDFLHVNSAGYAALNHALASVLTDIVPG